MMPDLSRACGFLRHIVEWLIEQSCLRQGACRVMQRMEKIGVGCDGRTDVGIEPWR